MNKLLPILIIGIALVTVIIFIIKNILIILAVIIFVVCIIGFFFLDSLNKLEKQYNIQLITKKQYKAMLSSLITPFFLAASYQEKHKVSDYDRVWSTGGSDSYGLSDSVLILIGLTPGVLVMLYLILQAGYKWSKFEASSKAR